MYKVKEVAELVGISVRTLHHYDEVGLLKPSQMSPAGYRLYSDLELEQLQQILFFREIGFSLVEIKGMLGRPDYDRKETLLKHRELLFHKQKRLEEMINTINQTIESIEGGVTMKANEMFDGFDMSAIEEQKRKYGAEAREKYGDQIVEETEKRTDQYGKGEWSRITAEREASYAAIVEAMERGPEDPVVQAAVAELRQQITNYFYECTPEIFRGLGEMYVADERFTANIDQYGAGLAAFLKEAIDVYCDRLGSSV